MVNPDQRLTADNGGGKRKHIAVHHRLEEYLRAYIDAAGISEGADAPLFRTVRGKTKQLTANRMTQDAAWYMLQRWARGADVDARLCNHTWRASGITTFLKTPERSRWSQYMAGHADPRTTKL